MVKYWAKKSLLKQKSVVLNSLTCMFSIAIGPSNKMSVSVLWHCQIMSCWGINNLTLITTRKAESWDTEYTVQTSISNGEIKYTPITVTIWEHFKASRIRSQVPTRMENPLLLIWVGISSSIVYNWKFQLELSFKVPCGLGKRFFLSLGWILWYFFQCGTFI